MTAANRNDFFNADHRMLAEGYDLSGESDIWVDPGGTERVPVTNGGMINPSPHTIPSGTNLFRYGTADAPDSVNLTSGWWLERRELDTIIGAAQHHQTSEGMVVRLLCCVPPEWGSQLDVVIGVRTNRELLAFRGLANSASAKARDGGPPTVIPARNEISSQRVHQLYIPGLRDPRTNQPTGRHEAFLTLQGKWPVSGRNWIYT